MTSLEAAAFWAGLNALLLIVLSARVGQARLKNRVNLGDGDNPEMIKAIRTQGNYIEYAPAAVGGLVLLALLNAPIALVHGLGGLFFLSRVFHLFGLGMGIWDKGRMFGTVGTMFTLLITGGSLIYLAIF